MEKVILNLLILTNDPLPDQVAKMSLDADKDLISAEKCEEQIKSIANGLGMEEGSYKGFFYIEDYFEDADDN